MARTAACVIVKNEARDIAEWIAYHSLLGFDALIIFDNQSTDETDRIVRAAAKTVSIHVWPWHRSDHETQTGAYEEACRTFRGEFDWIAFLDADEFLILHQDAHVRSLLDRCASFSGIGINWAIFGANGHENFHTDLVTQSFTRRSNTDFFQNRHIKSIVRPDQVIRCPNPHFFELDGAYCNPSATPLSWLREFCGHVLPAGLTADSPDFSVAQINHYFTRSKAHWTEKVHRGYPSNIAVRKLEEFSIYDRNEVEDVTATIHQHAIRARMDEFQRSLRV